MLWEDLTDLLSDELASEWWGTYRNWLWNYYMPTFPNHNPTRKGYVFAKKATRWEPWGP